MARTIRSVERELRATLMADNCHVHVRVLNDWWLALMGWGNPKAKTQPYLILDPMRGGLIGSAVHELIHATYKTPLSYWGRLEEPLVEALEEQVMKLIDNDKERVRWWRNAIHKKLEREKEDK